MGTTPQSNAALVRRFLTDVVAGGDTDAVDAFLAEDVVDHHLVFGDGGEGDDVAALGWRVLAGADVDVDIADSVATEERVAVRATVSGVHQESLMDLAPTGEPFEIAYVWFCRIEDGRIVEFWSLPDGFGLLQQLGAIPGLSNRRTNDHRDNQR